MDRQELIAKIQSGALMLEAPTGRPARAWTNEETERMRQAFKELFDDEAAMLCEQAGRI